MIDIGSKDFARPCYLFVRRKLQLRQSVFLPYLQLSYVRLLMSPCVSMYNPPLLLLLLRATSGDKLNNNKFSPCSLKKINSVLNSKARDTKGCFTMPQVRPFLL